MSPIKTALLSLAIFVLGTSKVYAADVDWEDWSFDVSTASNSSGLVLKNVKYRGELILGKASMPVMRVEYENDLCGPYADILAPSRLEPANSGAPDDVCKNQAVCRRSFTQNGEKKFEIGSNWQIGEYQIYQAYYFSEKGYIDTRVYSRGMQCVINHSHHAHWMFDFDIADAANDRILRGDSELQETEFNDVRSQTSHWTIEDPTSNTQVRLIPSEDDGEPDNFASWDAAARKFNSAEVGSWQLGARGEIGDNYITPAENINGTDLVMWYVSHLAHLAADGSSVWHSSGPRIEVVSDDDNPSPQPLPPGPPPATDEDNLLVNGGFEDAQSLAGWANCGDATRTESTDAASDGSRALRIYGGGCLYQQVAAMPATNYSLSCDANRNGNSWTILEFSFLDSNFGVLGTKEVRQVSTSGEFTTYRFTGLAPADTAYALTLFYSEDDTVIDACILLEGELAIPSEPAGEPISSNLLNNGGFEDGLSGWNSCAAENLSVASSEADVGLAALAISGGGCVYQQFPVNPGVAYNMKCRAKRNSGDLYTSAALAMMDGSYASQDRQELPVQSTAYQDYTASLTATSDSAFGTVVLYSESPGVFDDCEVLATR